MSFCSIIKCIIICFLLKTKVRKYVMWILITLKTLRRGCHSTFKAEKLVIKIFETIYINKKGKGKFI